MMERGSSTEAADCTQAVVINCVLQKSCTFGRSFTAECRVLCCSVSKEKEGSCSMHLPKPTFSFSGMKILY